MKKTLILLLTFALLINYSLAYSCITYRDCPKDECAGAVRQCIENICQTSQCIVPDASSIETREDVETFEQAVKPYEEGINLSIRTRNPNIIRNNIMASLGIQGVLLLILKAVGVFIITLLLALFIIFTKEKGILKILLIITLPLIIIVFGLLERRL